MTANRPLPCPFCGSPDSLTMANVFTFSFCIRCDMCRATGPIADSEDAAMERWNKAPRTQEMINLMCQDDLERLTTENSKLRAEIEENKSSIYETRRETLDEVIDVLNHMRRGDELYYD